MTANLYWGFTMRFGVLERFGKGVLGAVLAPVLKTSPTDVVRQGFSFRLKQSLHRVLIVKQDDRLGNLILMTPMLTALRQRLPGAEIHLLLSDLYASVFRADSRVDRLLIMEKRRQIRNPLVLLSFLKKLRAEKYDLAIEASDVNNFSFNNSLLARLARTEVRVGYNKRENRGLLNVALEPPERPVHATEMYLNLLRLLWADLSTPEMRVDIPPEEIEWGRSLLCSLGFQVSDRKVAIHLGGRGKKRLPVSEVAQLSAELSREFGMRLIFVSGPSEEKYLSRIKADLPPGSVFLSGLPILKLASLLANLELFISADTGPLHLAVACGCSTLSVFTSSDLNKFAPRGENHRQVRYFDGDFPLEELIEKVGELLPVPAEINRVS
jgi:ADP-heptose:LPS heptosyltransferase